MSLCLLSTGCMLIADRNMEFIEADWIFEGFDCSSLTLESCIFVLSFLA